MAPRSALVVFAPKWPVAHLITRRASTSATLDFDYNSRQLVCSLVYVVLSLTEGLLCGCKDDVGSL